jgi:calcineurin-like phosphoesterase family protein
MSDIWLTSDTHFGHANIIKYSDRPHHAFQKRPRYATVEEMNAEFVENINARVKPRDVLYHLGDVAMGSIDGWSQHIRALNGLRRCVAGNHDPTKQKLLDAGFHFAADQEYIVHRGLVLWLAHIPLSGDPWRGKLVRPEPLMPYDIALCGHVHEKWKIGPRGEINVGVDVWEYRPVHIDEVIELWLDKVAGA